MITWAEHVRRQQAILDTPRGTTVCVCGAPGGSAHDHMTGQVLLPPPLPQVREAETTRGVVRAVWAAGLLSPADGADEGLLLEALRVPWAVIRPLLRVARLAGYIEQRGGGYYATPLGEAWLTHGNRGAREQVQGRTRR